MYKSRVLAERVVLRHRHHQGWKTHTRAHSHSITATHIHTRASCICLDSCACMRVRANRRVVSRMLCVCSGYNDDYSNNAYVSIYHTVNLNRLRACVCVRARARSRSERGARFARQPRVRSLQRCQGLFSRRVKLGRVELNSIRACANCAHTHTQPLAAVPLSLCLATSSNWIAFNVLVRQWSARDFPRNNNKPCVCVIVNLQ